MRKYSTVPRQRERVGRDDADVGLDVDERAGIEVLGSITVLLMLVKILNSSATRMS
jgi:hypothetical protein